MGLVIMFVWLGGLALFAVGTVLLCRSNNSVDKFLSRISLIVLGTFFIAITTFIAIPLKLPSGLPETSIDAGEYKVAFVYAAGENVNVGIEKKDGENERLYLYQFPKSAFDSGSMNTQAKKLVVVESGNFRKLVLK